VGGMQARKETTRKLLDTFAIAVGYTEIDI